jgi:iron-sulfur cluster repair protein YtfE (RIC family)
VKRDAALTELSRDHHQALYRAMRMKRASEEDRADVREDVLAFWREHGRKHFRIEEELLQLRELGARLHDHVRHEERVLFPEIEQALNPEELSELANRIAAAETSG